MDAAKIKVVAVVVVVLLVGYAVAPMGKLERWWAGYAGYTEVCIGKVAYYQFTSGAAPAYNPDGTLKTCR